jgi:hypothetical protein
MEYKLTAYSEIPGEGNIISFWKEFSGSEEFSRILETDPEYYKFQADNRLFNGYPLLLSTISGDCPAIISAGVVGNFQYSPSIGFLKLKFIRFNKKYYHIFPYAVSGQINNPESIDAFLDNLYVYMKNNKIDYVFFSTLKKNSFISSYLFEKKNKLICDPLPVSDQHYILQTPESLNDFLAAKDAKSRYNLKRLARMIECSSEWKPEIKIFHSPEDIKIFFNDAETIARNSQPRAINVGFRNTETEYKKRTWLAEKGFFRSYILYLNGTPAAFINGTLYKKRFYTEDIGYDLKYEKYSPGSYLRLKMIQDIAASGCAEIIDYGFGTDDYKKRFSSYSIDEIRIRMYVPNFSNYLFLGHLIFFNFLSGIVRKTLKSTGLYTSIKKTYRSIRRKLLSAK